MIIKSVRKPVWGNKEKTSVLLEIEAEGLGWLPFGAEPDDDEEHGQELFRRAVAGEFGPIAPYVDPVELKPAKKLDDHKRDINMWATFHMEKAARERGYDSMVNAISYADEPAVPTYQLEGKAFRVWRSLVWQQVEVIVADCEAKKRDWPTQEQLIKELPTLGL